jgi:hypothetical protein
LALLTAFCQEGMPCPCAAPIVCLTSCGFCARRRVRLPPLRSPTNLEVTVRMVYRDIATLQARRIPIEGAPGIGYVLRCGFELPPLMFTEDEAEAIAVGVRMLARTGDPGLQKAAESVLSKVTLVVPDLLREYLCATPVYVSKSGAPVPARRDLPTVIRHAIRDSRKMGIDYQDEAGRRTERVIQPFAVASEAGLRAEALKRFRKGSYDFGEFVARWPRLQTDRHLIVDTVQARFRSWPNRTARSLMGISGLKPPASSKPNWSSPNPVS